MNISREIRFIITITEYWRKDSFVTLFITLERTTFALRERGVGGKDRYPTDNGIYSVESLLGEIKGGETRNDRCAADNRRVLNAIMQ